MPPLQTGADDVVIEVAGQLAEPVAAGVLRLADAAATADGVGPLSEHVLLQLRYGAGDHARHLVLTSHGELAGYAYLDFADHAEGPGGELVISPARRRRGLGLRLTRALLAEAGSSPLRLWAHGDLPGADALAARAGFERIRALWTMRRPLREPLPTPQYPPGVTVRTFTVGADEAAWLALNRAAFASHPEQGGWTGEDLSLREREPWFDPAGFFLAERSGVLAGFHWTKVHEGHPGGTAARDGAARPHPALGEVYVVGVDPGGQGSGLGRALTLEGLRYLQFRGLPEVMLYVDEENTPAIRLYQSLGFRQAGTDVMYQHPGVTASSRARMTPAAGQDDSD